MKRMILAALTVLSLAACSCPTINGPSDTGSCFPANRCGDANGPHDNAAKSLDGRNIGGAALAQGLPAGTVPPVYGSQALPDHTRKDGQAPADGVGERSGPSGSAATPSGPYDNTANSLNGRYIGGAYGG